MTRAASGPTHADGPMVFVESLDSPELQPEDRHHLGRVLRVRNGAAIVLCDGRGAWARSHLGDQVECDGPVYQAAPLAPMRVGFALTKGDKPELAVQKLTELGVDEIVAFTSDHCVVRWDERRSERQLERFERIAREASMQCRRTVLPRVGPITEFAALTAGDHGRSVVIADMDAERSLLDLASASMRSGSGLPMVLVGPEGGWSPAERGCGVGLVGLAAHVLRAETAAIAAGVLLSAARETVADRGVSTPGE